MELKDALARVTARADLSEEEIAAVFGRIMDGEATPAQIGGLLVALRMKGETGGEIAGAARAMRARMLRVEGDGAVDTCGTGGDGASTVNVSTMAALAVAACGVKVAKHGNRALTSKSGSADVLEALGVRVDLGAAEALRCLDEVGIAFLFAPTFHAATRHAAAPRRELGVRTLFNLLGPLTNPAGVKRQVVGVFAPAFQEPLAEALGRLGAERAFVVNARVGDGFLDEVSVAGETRVAEWTGSQVVTYSVTPADFGLAEVDPAGLAGGDATANAAVLRAVLAGAPGAPRNATVLSAAMTLVAAGRAADFAAGARLAQAALDDGTARTLLERWVVFR